MSQSQCTIKERALQTLLGRLVQDANQPCHFSQRHSPLTAERFVQTLVLGWLKQPTASLNTLAQFAQTLGVPVSGSALQERLGPEAVMLLASVVAAAVGRLHQRHALPVAVLKDAFSGVYITDSTQIALPTSLAPLFAGNQGNAILKLQVTFDYLYGNVTALELVAGKSPDQACALPVRQARAGSLSLFDLGYFKQERLQAIDQAPGWFVSRCQTQTALYEPDTDQRLAVVTWLKRLKGDHAERVVEVGQRVHLPVRLVVRRVAPVVAQRRRRKAKAKAKRQGSQCTQDYLYLLGWDLLITNLPAADWPAALLFDLYRIRGQIEWVFRIWKSQLGLAHIGHWQVERVLCQVYAHLLAALVCHLLTADWRWRSPNEYSLAKAVQIIQEHVGALLTCIARGWRGLGGWRLRLEAAFRRFGRKTKRKQHPSTCQTLIHWGLT